VLALAGCGGGDDGGAPPDAVPTATVEPVPLPGPYPIACSNVAQGFGRVAPGAGVQDYWRGRPAPDGTPRYVSDLLTEPADTLSVTVDAPSDSRLFGTFAGRAVGFVVLVCYPTAADNTRADFALPGGQRIPRMQRGAEAPLFADASLRHPLIAFSHGLAQGPRQMVALSGVEHELDTTAGPDILTWSLTFLDAHVRGLPGARAQLSAMGSVAGGGDDRLVVPLRGAAP
jgi:hypothetical protein